MNKRRADWRAISRFTAKAMLLLLALSAVPAVAQTESLTSDQRRMLDQLPPEQRRQALEAIEQFEGGADSGNVVEPDSTAGTEEQNRRGTAAQRAAETIGVATGGARLVVLFVPKLTLDETELEGLREDPALSRLEGHNYFELDEDGILELPGLGSIRLRGLNEDEIAMRLRAEPDLEPFDVTATLLGIETAELDTIRPFGYDVFGPIDETDPPFLSPAIGPVPPDYVLGPGDTVRLQLYGNVNQVAEITVTRDGELNLPELGPIPVAGLTFTEFREDLNRRVDRMLIGTQLSVTMGQLRTIQVFVLGDVDRPGSYVVSSLTTISSALYAAGGVSEIGSLRRIEHKRRGRLVGSMDLYELLLKGDSSADRRLQSGDVIFVNPVGPTVEVAGAVRRPAIYEMDAETTAAEVVAVAGGLLPEAFPAASRIERIDSADRRVTITLDLDTIDGGATRLADGDALFVPKVLPRLDRSVALAGHVMRPGSVELRPGMRIVDLLPSADHLKPGADTGYILIRREIPETQGISALSVNLAAAWANPSGTENLRLQSRDMVTVFSLEFGRQRMIEPLLVELELQSSLDDPYREVSITGFVRAPGVYPLEPGMRISDLVRAGGSLREDAYGSTAELARYDVGDSGHRDAIVIPVDLAAVLRGDASADFPLEEHDNLRISAVPDWDVLSSVTLEGEVRFPGEYRIRRGETLREVIERAGGLTEEAFPEGVIFIRESLKSREQEQIDRLVRRLEADLTTLSLETIETTGSETLDTGRVLLDQLRATEAVGRLVIDPGLLSASAVSTESTPIVLRDNDRLLIPREAAEVTVIGETQQNTSHLHRPGLTREDYINMSGGLTRRADKKLIYVVRANGAVVTQNRLRWLGRNRKIEIRPGDTIVVPLETDRVRPLRLWADVTQILYQAAIAVAAVSSFND